MSIIYIPPSGGGSFKGDYNDLTNVPIKDARRIEEVHLTFNGDYENYEYITDEQIGETFFSPYIIASTQYFVRVGDCPSISEMQDLEVSLYMDGETMSASAQVSDMEKYTDILYALLNTSVIFITEDKGEIRQGIYFVCILMEEELFQYISSLKYKITTGEIKKLDNDFLQDDVVIKNSLTVNGKEISTDELGKFIKYKEEIILSTDEIVMYNIEDVAGVSTRLKVPPYGVYENSYGSVDFDSVNSPTITVNYTVLSTNETKTVTFSGMIKEEYEKMLYMESDTHNFNVFFFDPFGEIENFDNQIIFMLSDYNYGWDGTNVIINSIEWTDLFIMDSLLVTKDDFKYCPQGESYELVGKYSNIEMKDGYGIITNVGYIDFSNLVSPKITFNCTIPSTSEKVEFTITDWKLVDYYRDGNCSLEYSDGEMYVSVYGYDAFDLIEDYNHQPIISIWDGARNEAYDVDNIIWTDISVDNKVKHNFIESVDYSSVINVPNQIIDITNSFSKTLSTTEYSKLYQNILNLTENTNFNENPKGITPSKASKISSTKIQDKTVRLVDIYNVYPNSTGFKFTVDHSNFYNIYITNGSMSAYVEIVNDFDKEVRETIKVDGTSPLINLYLSAGDYYLLISKQRSNNSDIQLLLDEIKIWSDGSKADAYEPTTAFSNVLLKDNKEEYTPTESYNPATKKYVDDMIKFNADGELEITINGVTKVFTPKE